MLCRYRPRRVGIVFSITIIRDWVHLIHLMCHYLSLLTYDASGVVTIDNGAFVSKLVRVVVHFLRRVWSGMFTLKDGFVEAIVRGKKSELLCADDYAKLRQCESLSDLKLYLVSCWCSLRTPKDEICRPRNITTPNYRVERTRRIQRGSCGLVQISLWTTFNNLQPWCALRHRLFQSIWWFIGIWTSGYSFELYCVQFHDR